MAIEQDNGSRLRPFWGELLESTAPLEASFNDCAYSCTYCFASLNGREVKHTTAQGTMRAIARAFSPEHDPSNFTETLLRERRAIVLSNAVDPLGKTNLDITMQLLPVLSRFGVPVALQTRGFRENEKEKFREVLSVLPKKSVVYMSLTTFDQEIARVVERGTPRAETVLEQLAMAKEAGFNTVAAINPAVPEYMGDPYKFVERCVQIAGKGAIDGTWIEALHISRRQMTAAQKRAPTGGVLPVIIDDPFKRAAKGEYDGDFMVELADACDEQNWKRFTHGASDAMGFRDDLFELYPNPFITYHPVIRECNRLYQESVAAGKPKSVLVSFDAWKSWVGFKPENPYVLKRGDFWAFVNLKQNAGQENRKVLPELLSLEQACQFLWNAPWIEAKAIGVNMSLKAIVHETEDGNVDSTEFYRENEDGSGNLLYAFAPDRGGEGKCYVVPYDEVAPNDSADDFLVLPLKGEAPAQA